MHGHYLRMIYDFRFTSILIIELYVETLIATD